MLILLPTAASTAVPTILVIGDSISGAHGMAAERGWVAGLRERLRAEGYPHRVINASVGGDTTAGARERLPSALEKHQPSVVILQIGGNDGLRGLSPGAMEENLAAMVKDARAAGARVMLAGVRLPPNYGTAYAEQFRNAYARVAESRDIVFLPRILDGFEGRRDLMLDDEIHPNEAGHEVILDNVWPVLEPLVADTASTQQ